MHKRLLFYTVIFLSCHIFNNCRIDGSEKSADISKKYSHPDFLRNWDAEVFATGGPYSATKYISNRDLKYISELPGIKKIRLFHVTINNDGLKHLAKMKSLEFLYLYHCNITDLDIPVLIKCQKLKFLGLSGSRISGIGLQLLSKHNSLNKIFLHGTKFISLDAKNSFKINNKHIKVEW